MRTCLDADAFEHPAAAMISESFTRASRVSTYGGTIPGRA